MNINDGTDIHPDKWASIDPNTWGAVLEKSEGNTLHCNVQPSPYGIVGKWKLKVESSLKGQNKYDEADYGGEIYIIFNPFCQCKYIIII